jgi:hypothetical protein
LTQYPARTGIDFAAGAPVSGTEEVS